MKKTTQKRPKKIPAKTPRPLRLVYVEAGSLADNPANWRRHPEGQKTALKATLTELGWAGALLFNQITGHLIDGHARKASVPPKTLVPVLLGRWSIEQEKKILVTLDPLGAMAQADGESLSKLLADLELPAGTDELGSLLEKLSQQSADGTAAQERKKAEKNSAARAKKVSELYSVIVECKNEKDQLAFYNRMKDKEHRKCKLYVL